MGFLLDCLIWLAVAVASWFAVVALWGFYSVDYDNLRPILGKGPLSPGEAKGMCGTAVCSARDSILLALLAYMSWNWIPGYLRIATVSLVCAYGLFALVVVVAVAIRLKRSKAAGGSGFGDWPNRHLQ